MEWNGHWAASTSIIESVVIKASKIHTICIVPCMERDGINNGMNGCCLLEAPNVAFFVGTIMAPLGLSPVLPPSSVALLISSGVLFL